MLCPSHLWSEIFWQVETVLKWPYPRTFGWVLITEWSVISVHCNSCQKNPGTHPKVRSVSCLWGSSRTLWWRTHWGNYDTVCYPKHCYTIHLNDYEKISVSNARAHPHVSVTELVVGSVPFLFIHFSLLVIPLFILVPTLLFPIASPSRGLPGASSAFRIKVVKWKLVLFRSVPSPFPLTYKITINTKSLLRTPRS